jgi:hypothetical protein
MLRSHNLETHASGSVLNVSVKAIPFTSVLQDIYPPVITVDDTPESTVWVSVNVLALDVKTTSVDRAPLEIDWFGRG